MCLGDFRALIGQIKWNSISQLLLGMFLPSLNYFSHFYQLLGFQLVFSQIDQINLLHNVKKLINTLC